MTLTQAQQLALGLASYRHQSKPVSVEEFDDGALATLENGDVLLVRPWGKVIESGSKRLALPSLGDEPCLP